MRFRSGFLVLLTVLSTQLSTGARAEIFMWQDHDTKISLTYPDRWKMRAHQKTDDILTIAAPGENEHATCRLRVRDDRRFIVYPRVYDANIQRLHMSRDFWDDYLGEYNDVTLHEVYDNQAMGIGAASRADATYVTTAGPKVMKRSIMFASLYNGKAYVLECSAEEQAFNKWYNSFQSVLKSISIRPIMNGRPNGHYRDFQNDMPLKIYNARPVDTYAY